MSRWGMSVGLVAASCRVLARHKGLLVFPVLSGIAALAVVAGAGAAVWATPRAHGLSPAAWALIAVGYFLLAFVTIFCNAALVNEADAALRGNPATVLGGLRGAGRQLGSILVWSLVSCTVSLLIRVIGERLGFVGRLIESVLGLAWSITTYLVIPVIVVERASPARTVRRSGELLRRGWGLQLVANLGLGLLSTVAMLVLVVLPAVVAAIVGGHAGLALLAVPAVGLVAVLVVSGTVSGLVRAAVYRYAVEGKAPEAFAAVDLSMAFRAKR